MESDRNYWKPKYATEWKAGVSRVKHALNVLKKKFPNLTIEVTEYALRDDYIPPDKKHKRHEANIILKHEDNIIVDIEVTGSNIEMTPPNDIFILRGKYQAAQKRKREEKIDTWFYTIYQDSEYVLDLTLVGKFNANKAQVKYLKGVPEWYICIPCAEAYPKENLFKWVEEQISNHI